MTALAQARRQASLLLRLRQVRMDAAARALATARDATVRAEAARAEADVATAEADAAQRDARERLGDDLQEAERLLAVVDQARFRAAMAVKTLEEARDEERERRTAEADHRRLMILARARHAGVEERATALARRMRRQRDEREQMDLDDRRTRS